jgi:hypothetical protein
MRRWILVAVVVPSYFLPPQVIAQQSNLNQVLSWLPVDTETILGANGPFAWDPTKALSDDSASHEPLTTTELEMQSRMFPMALLDFKNGGLGEFVKGKTVSLAIEGSRRFRPPRALGGMRYDGCLIIVFVPTVSLDGAAFMRAAAKSAVRFEEHNGTRISVFEEEAENDTWTTFVGFPRSNVVVVATNLDYLLTLLDRMRVPGTRALPQGLLEWKYVKTSAPVWGMRHYQKQGAELDPSSPFQGRKAANIPDANAVGVTFSFAPAVDRTATVDYLSTNPDVQRILSGYLMMADAATAAPRESQMHLRQPAIGVLEASINLSATEAIDRLLFGLLAMLGHAVYV